jgi:hypothetical protein
MQIDRRLGDPSIFDEDLERGHNTALGGVGG